MVSAASYSPWKSEVPVVTAQRVRCDRRNERGTRHAEAPALRRGGRPGVDLGMGASAASALACVSGHGRRTLVTAHSSYKHLSTCGQLPPVPPPLLSALLPAHAAAITAPAEQRVTAFSVSLHRPVSPAVLFGHLGGVHSLPEKQLRGEPVAEPVGTRRPPSWLPWGNASGASWAQQVTQQQGHLV